jgi:hypothetical protein
MKKVLKFLIFAGLAVLLTACTDFTPEGMGGQYNVFVIALAIGAGAILAFFIVLGIVSAFYKGKDVKVKIIKKKESKVLRGGVMGRTSPGYRGGGDTSRKARRQKGRLRYSKVTIEFVELEGQQKTVKCNDIVIFDKLVVGKTQRVRVRFGEIVKILK